MCFSTLHTLMTMSNFMFSYLRQCHSFANKSCYSSLRRVVVLNAKICNKNLPTVHNQTGVLSYLSLLPIENWIVNSFNCNTFLYLFPKNNSIEWGTVVLHDPSKFYIYPFGFNPHFPGPGPTNIHTNTNFFFVILQLILHAVLSLTPNSLWSQPTRKPMYQCDLEVLSTKRILKCLVLWEFWNLCYHVVAYSSERLWSTYLP